MWYLIVSVPDLCTLTYFHLYPYPMVVQHEKLQLALWFQRIYEYIVQSINTETIRGMT